MTTYENVLAMGMKAQRLNQIGQLQSQLLTSLREPNFMFQLCGLNFVGEDSVRVRMALIRELEALSQDGRKELEAQGVTFPPPVMPAPANTSDMAQEDQPSFDGPDDPPKAAGAESVLN